MSKLYVAGPMTGRPGFNYEAFREAAERLRAAGYEVADPSAMGLVGAPYKECIRRGLDLLFTCDGVALLPEWHTSRGATLERQAAETVGMAVQSLSWWLAKAAYEDAAEARP